MGYGGVGLLSGDELPDDSTWFKSGRSCDGCEQDIAYTEEVVVASVMEAMEENGQVFTDILRDEDDQDYQFAPYVMHVECWEGILSDIEEAVADELPVPAQEVVLVCMCCESEIGPQEPFVGTQFGELRVSRRSPEGVPTPTVEELGRMKPVCLLCIVRVIDDHLPDWEDLADLAPEFEGEEE